MIVVIGCGRVGLPLCLFLASKGLRVVGVDTNSKMVSRIKQGKMPFQEKGADLLLEKTLKDGSFSITQSLEEVAKEAEIFIITVGTALDSKFIPDHRMILQLVNRIMDFRNGKAAAVFLRSTIAPGTSHLVSRQLKERNIRIGRDFFYAFCPERIAEGRALEELASLPQIIGAFDEASAQKAADFFSNLGIPCILGSPREAELAKLFTNMYRYVNFALANEFMYLAEKNDAGIGTILKMCNQGYDRGGPWLPGYAAGPCLAKDGFFLTNTLLFSDLVFSSWKINESLPEVLLKEVLAIRPLGRVALLGLAFKAGVDDMRDSLGVKLYTILKNRGAAVKAHDPLIQYCGSSGNIQDVVAGASEIFVMAPHKEYKDLSLDEIREMAGCKPLIVDPWLLWNDRVIYS